MNKKVFYTAITGGYDTLEQPRVVRQDFDYICFSNDIPEPYVGIWAIRKIPFRHSQNKRVAMYPKLNPHLVLPEYEYSIWVDGNIKLETSEIADRGDELIHSGSLCGVVLHPERTCVYQEAEVLIRLLIGEPSLVYKHVKHLIRDHYPVASGLYVTSVIFRKHMDESIIHFSTLWWHDYMRFSCRDQMGVNHAIFKTGVVPDIFLPTDYLVRCTRNYQRNDVHVQKRKRKSPWTLLPKLVWRLTLRNMFTFRLWLLYMANGIEWFSMQSLIKRS